MKKKNARCVEITEYIELTEPEEKKPFILVDGKQLTVDEIRLLISYVRAGRELCQTS